jgi:hypothetical protein
VSTKDVVADLAWAGYRSGWSLHPWHIRTGPGFGVVLAGTGASADRLRDLESATTTRCDRFNDRIEFVGQAVVPLCKSGDDNERTQYDRAMVTALCTLLARRPALRARLCEQARTAKLLGAVRSSPMWGRAHRVGLGRHTSEISTAMEAVGLVHHIGGRPVPGDALPTRDEAIDSVIKHISSNGLSSYRRDDTRTIDLLGIVFRCRA